MGFKTIAEIVHPGRKARTGLKVEDASAEVAREEADVGAVGVRDRLLLVFRADRTDRVTEVRSPSYQAIPNRVFALWDDYALMENRHLAANEGSKGDLPYGTHGRSVYNLVI